MRLRAGARILSSLFMLSIPVLAKTSGPLPNPARNPHYYQALVKKFLDTFPIVDNTLYLGLMKAFNLAASQKQSAHGPTCDASELQGLMQLLS